MHTKTLKFSVASDLHIGTPHYFTSETFAAVNEHSDFLLLAGDLTQHGNYDEVMELTAALDNITCPIYAVLGNHDVYTKPRYFKEAWENKTNIHCLNGEHDSFYIRGLRIGIAGTKGSAGGYAPHLLRGFGEPALSTIQEISILEASRLDSALQGLSQGEFDFKIALTHYAPFKENLGNEAVEIYCVLGNSKLGDVIKQHQVDFCAHGHAHLGAQGLFPIPDGHGHYMNASLAANNNQVCHLTWNGDSLSLSHI